VTPVAEAKPIAKVTPVAEAKPTAKVMPKYDLRFACEKDIICIIRTRK